MAVSYDKLWKLLIDKRSMEQVPPGWENYGIDLSHAAMEAAPFWQ